VLEHILCVLGTGGMDIARRKKELELIVLTSEHVHLPLPIDF